MSQARLAQEMTKRMRTVWRQSRVWKLLWCDMPITLPMYEAAAECLGLTLADLVMGSRTAGNGWILDKHEEQLVQRLRQTGTMGLMCEFVANVCPPSSDGRARNGKQHKAKARTAA